MAVNQNRPFERHFVSNIPTLLPAGLTLGDLAQGQIGIFDAKTNLSVTAPTYAVNKAIYFAQGTPDRSAFPEGAMVPNMVRRSHTIQGKLLKGLRGSKANKGLGEIVTLGFDGIDTTKTLSGKAGETFYYWVRLTGDPIFNLNPDRSKGVIVQGAISLPCPDDCSDNCGPVDCNFIADAIVADWNTKILPGGQKANQYVEICKVVDCAEDPALTTVAYEQYTIFIVDDGSQSALGEVQAQYPGKGVTRIGRNGITSTYAFTQLQSEGAPAAFNQAAGTVIPNCDTCPAGATATPALTQFELKVQQTDATDQSAAQKATIEAAHAAYTVTVVLSQFDANVGTATYVVTSDIVLGVALTAAQITTALNATTDGIATLLGTSAPFCTLAASTVNWESPTQDFCKRVQVQFVISIKDDICGNTYLAELQELYKNIPVDGGSASGTVTVNEGSGCVHQYTLTTLSKNCVPDNCCATDVVFPDVPAFGTQAWTKVDLNTAGTAPCVCGVQFTSKFTPRKESECTFGNWAHQVDWVHIEASSHNPDWRSTDLCENDPIATRIQNGKYPNGEGPMVVRIERQDRMYDLDYFYLSPVLREAFDYYFEASFDRYYDMVAVEYDFQYSSNNGFGQYDNDRYVQHFWLPETQAGALVTALNTYAVSVPIMVDPLVY